MRYPKGCPTHICCPPEWRHTPNITGSFELDAIIHSNPNTDMTNRLVFYAGLGSPSQRSMYAYGPRTNYDGYDGYSGDE